MSWLGLRRNEGVIPVLCSVEFKIGVEIMSVLSENKLVVPPTQQRD